MTASYHFVNNTLPTLVLSFTFSTIIMLIIIIYIAYKAIKSKTAHPIAVIFIILITSPLDLMAVMFASGLPFIINSIKLSEPVQHKSIISNKDWKVLEGTSSVYTGSGKHKTRVTKPTKTDLCTIDIKSWVENADELDKLSIWNPNRKPSKYSFRVTKKIYDSLNINDEVTVTTRTGILGLELIDDIKDKNNVSFYSSIQ